MTSTKQNLFKSEYELELETWLRRRFRAVCWAYMGMGAVALSYRVLTTFLTDAPELAGWRRWVAIALLLATGGTQLAVAIGFLTARHWAQATREQLLKGVSQMVGLLGVIAILRYVLMPAVGQEEVDFLLPLFFWHLTACAVLPWTPRESLRAFLPLWVGWVAVKLVFVLTGQYDWGSWILMLALSWGLLIPGYAICAMRLQQHGRNFRTRMVGKYFMTMRQEYAKARSIHENMFPAAFDNGTVRFEYTYTPMQELGGDYIHAHTTPDGCVHLTLIDVTGHGLPAALTVNRLFGELERIHAEAEVAEPALLHEQSLGAFDELAVGELQVGVGELQLEPLELVEACAGDLD
ncbi:MAG TPA: hypothetical protein VG711_06165, partial [Phycisphaerales bacterium]|nr:hypothetical protein [Phycisphaerales bacterium]